MAGRLGVDVADPAVKLAVAEIWSNNSQERLSKEVRRRTDVVGVLPRSRCRDPTRGQVLRRQREEWALVRRYMTAEPLAKARLEVID